MACLTAYIIYFCAETHYEKCLKKVSRFVHEQNEQVGEAKENYCRDLFHCLVLGLDEARVIDHRSSRTGLESGGDLTLDGTRSWKRSTSAATGLTLMRLALVPQMLLVLRLSYRP